MPKLIFRSPCRGARSGQGAVSFRGSKLLSRLEPDVR